MNRRYVLTMIAGLTIGLVAGPTHAQVNVNSNVVNFRTNTTANKGQKTSHYGNLEIFGNGTAPFNSVLYVKNDNTDAYNRYAVYGNSTPTNGYGWGGYFLGGSTGVCGYGFSDGSGSRFGGQFTAAGAGTGTKYGALINAQGAGTKYGVYVVATGTPGYGIYASGSTLAGQFSGSGTYTGTWVQASDERLKTNVAAVDGALQKIMALKPKSYTYDRDTYSKMNLPEGKHYGLLAQEAELVIPEVVSTISAPEGMTKASSAPEQYKAIDYIGLVPILVAALQEQQKRIEALEKALGAK